MSVSLALQNTFETIMDMISKEFALTIDYTTKLQGLHHTLQPYNKPIVMISLVVISLIATSSVSAYSFIGSSNARCIVADSEHGTKEPVAALRSRGMSMFLGQVSKLNYDADTTTIGTMTVPSVGIGTISWSSDSCKSMMSNSSVYKKSLGDHLIELTHLHPRIPLITK